MSPRLRRPGGTASQKGEQSGDPAGGRGSRGGRASRGQSYTLGGRTLRLEDGDRTRTGVRHTWMGGQGAARSDSRTPQVPVPGSPAASPPGMEPHVEPP